MMMQRRHEKNTFVGELEISYLDNYRKCFHYEQAADHRQQKFLFDENRDGSNGAPSASEPTSPIKISAGYALYQRKPMLEPTSAPPNTVISPACLRNAIRKYPENKKCPDRY